jgi:hypothetical protein
MSRPKLAAGGARSANTLATEPKEKRQKKALAASGHFRLLSVSLFLSYLPHPGFFDIDVSAAHCS